jgi:hypothetical protein
LRDRQGGVLAALSLVDRREVLDEARSDQMRLALSLAAEAFEARIRPCLPARPASEPAAPPRGFAFRGDPALGPLLPS